MVLIHGHKDKPQGQRWRGWDTQGPQGPIYGPGGGSRLCQMGTQLSGEVEVGQTVGFTRRRAWLGVWEGPQVSVGSVVTAGVDSAMDVTPAEHFGLPSH